LRGPGGGSRISSVVEAKGREAVLLPGDITNKAFCEAWVRKAVIDIGGRNILVNNAGK
jgi:NAD(P)-dependent dehydrogenase (short-subunit alcohol dehydrogenase family)